MTKIHPTAIIDPRAELDDDVEVGPYCVIDGPVRLGAGCVLAAHVTVMGDTTLGAGNRLYSGAVIGAEPQDLKYDGTPTRLVVGDHNRFREHVTVHPGTQGAGSMTKIGSHGLFMVGCHVAHDCRIGDNIILANHVLLAGHITVGDRAVLNGASACHHFTKVGRMAYVGGLTRVTQDVHPFTIVEGHPARVRGCNIVGLRRAGVEDEGIALLKRAIYSIFLSHKVSSAEAIAQLDEQGHESGLLDELLVSIRASDEGRQGRSAEKIGRSG